MTLDTDGKSIPLDRISVDTKIGSSLSIKAFSNLYLFSCDRSFENDST